MTLIPGRKRGLVITELEGFPRNTSQFLRADGTFAVPPGGGGGGGDVAGPATSIDTHIATFSGTTGKVLADSGVLIGSVVLTTDSRLSDARTPTAHAASHAAAGSDPVALSESQVANLVSDLAGKVPTARLVSAGTGLTGGGDLSADRTLTVAYGTAAGTAAQGNDTRLSDARTPTAHASSHKSGGSDAIKLDELAAPTDVTTLNASTSAHGLLKKLSNVATEFLNGQGTFTTPASGGWTVITNTATGATNNWAPAGLSGNTIIEWNGAADAAFTGLAGGVTGQLVTIKNITAAKIATFAHQSGSSSAGSKFTNVATSAATPVAPSGEVTFQHDGTDWQLVAHEQGAWITPAFSAGDFTASGSMTWTVDAGDVRTYRYKLQGRTLLVEMVILTTTTGGTASTALYVKVPGGFSAAGEYTGSHFYFNDVSPWTMGPNWIEGVTNPTKIQMYTAGFGSANWALATNHIYFYSNIAFEVL